MASGAIGLLAVMPSGAAAAERAAGPPHVTIVSSFPLTWAAPYTIPITNAIRMAIADAGGKVDGVRIDWLSLDDGSPAGGWPGEIANATAAAADPSVVAYLGPFNSSAARVSIAILCSAGVAMMSPSNTRDGLTKALPVNDPGEPGVYYPNDCARNYSRDIPRDSVEGAVGAVHAKSLGFHDAYVVQTVPTNRWAYGFVTRAGQIGLPVVAFDTVPGNSPSFSDLAGRVHTSGADLVFLACFQGVDQCGRLTSDIRAANPGIGIMVTDTSGVGSGFAEQAGSAADGVIDVRAILAPADFTGRAAGWYARYVARFGAPEPEDFNGVVYAYEATAVVLNAISASRNHIDRASVRGALMSTRNYEGLLGTWSLDADGDTTSSMLSTAEFIGGAWVSTGPASLP